MIPRRRVATLAVAIEPEGIVLCHARTGQPALPSCVRLPVSAEMLRTEPARAGADLRRLLAAAHVRHEACTVCLPLAWAFTLCLDVEDGVGDAEARQLVEAEAERSCPMGLADLSYAVVGPGPDGTPRNAFFAALPAADVAAVETALRAAGLRPVSMTLQGLSLVAEAKAEDGAHLLIGPGVVDLAVALGGRIVALRNLFWAGTDDHPDQAGLGREVARELRITLAGLPAAQRAQLRRVYLYGAEGLPGTVSRMLTDALARQGLAVVHRPGDGASQDHEAPPDLAACALRPVQGGRFRIELLPRRVSRLQRTALKLSERRTRVLVGAAVAVLVVVGGMWALQHHRLARLEAQWATVGPGVTEVKGLQDQVRKYRSWFDDTLPALTMARSIAEAFPEEGSVWLKALQIKGGATVTCTGTARTRADWMAMLEKLRSNKQIRDVQVVSTRGDAPLTFTVTLRWSRSDSHE